MRFEIAQVRRGNTARLRAEGDERRWTGRRLRDVADADAAATGTLLCTISIASGGTGINFDTAAAAGVLAKAPGETWSGVNAATGTAGYFRHVAAGDTAASSTTQARIQGSVGVVGSDLNLTSVSLVAAATQTIDFYTVALPLA